MLKAIAILVCLLVILPCMVAVLGIIYLLVCDTIERRQYWKERNNHYNNQKENGDI